MIRHAKKEDADSCIRLLSETKEDYPPQIKESILKKLADERANREVFVSMDDDVLEGFVIFSRTNKELLMLAIHPDYRNQGVATKLIYTVAGCFEPEDEISVNFFGDEDQIRELKGFYYSCGFEDDDDEEKKGQRLIYRV